MPAQSGKDHNMPKILLRNAKKLDSALAHCHLITAYLKSTNNENLNILARIALPKIRSEIVIGVECRRQTSNDRRILLGQTAVCSKTTTQSEEEFSQLNYRLG